MKNAFLILGILAIFQTVNGQEVITDFLYRAGDRSSYPSNFVEVNQKLFYTARTESIGNEIWVTEGGIGESYLLKDIHPGKQNGVLASFSKASVVINDTLYFIAQDGCSNGEIWKTDGTIDGTEKVTNFLNANIAALTLIGEEFYFLIKENDLLQVWKSDGSAEGTELIRGNLSIWNQPSFQGKCKNTFLFTFQPYGTNDTRVWRSDGTFEGTFPITEEIDGNGAGESGTSDLTQYIEFNDELYFVSRNYLYKTDGTLENTTTITTLHAASTRLVDYADVVEVNGKLYFSFFEIDLNRLFIWESDGTALGSKKIYDELGSRYFMTSNLLGNGSSLLFCGLNDTGGTSLMNLDLTTYSTSEIIELQSEIETPFIFIEEFDLCVLERINQDKIFCSSPIGNRQRKGWISRLSAETTSNIEALDDVVSIFNFDNSIYFSQKSDLEGIELWGSDDDHENFYLLDNVNKSKFGLNDEPLLPLNSSLIFTGHNGDIGDELWYYAGSTNLLKDIRTGPTGSNSFAFANYNNDIYFTANDSIHGFELWKTNGTASGTELVHDIVEGASSSLPLFLTAFQEQLFFIVYKDGRYHLCKSDGDNLVFLKDLGQNEFGIPFQVEEMISCGDYLYFVTDAAGEDLWISNGTEEGTYKLKDFYSCENLTDVDGKLFFTAYEAFQGEMELWSTDGTLPNTKLVKDIGTGYASEPKDLIHFNGLLFFTASTNEYGRELWKSDGTEEGTKQIMDIYTGSQGAVQDANFCVLNNYLFFSAKTSEHGFELWKTDGSELGTTIVRDINQGMESSVPAQLVAINDLIYFQAFDGQNGSELWRTDGTESGTLIVADIIPGNIGSSPFNITAVNNDVFFIAETTDMGQQIWKIPYNTISSLPETFDATEITVYPNPSIDQIHFTTDVRIGMVSIYNSNGQLIRNEKPVKNSMDVSSLPIGFYLLQFDTEVGTLSKKILKR